MTDPLASWQDTEPLRAVEAHREAVPPRNAREADRALWQALDAIGGDDG